MTPIEIARTYLDCLQRNDGPGAAGLFAADGVLDDGNGGHHVGRDQIVAFYASLARGVTVTTERVVEAPGRVSVWGYVGSSELARSMFRWIFHLSGGQITHLGNSFVKALPQ